MVASSCGRSRGPDYGRIFDHELVAAVQRIAGNGTGDTRWKVPGVNILAEAVDELEEACGQAGIDREVVERVIASG